MTLPVICALRFFLLILLERIESRIYLIRGQKVMLDFDLAELYGGGDKIFEATS